MLMKVEIIKNYYDSTKNKELIEAGTELTVSAERGKELIDAGVAKEIKVEVEETKTVKTTKKQKNK